MSEQIPDPNETNEKSTKPSQDFKAFQVTPPVLTGSPETSRPGSEIPELSEKDALPIMGIAGVLDAILRQPRRLTHQFKEANAPGLIVSLLLISVFCSIVYGVIVGTFSGGNQYWAAPLKISSGMLVSALICLPSLYIFSCLGGARAGITEILGLVTGLLALITILLIGFAPVAWVFSQSTQSIAVMGSLHLGFWGVALFFGLRFLMSGFSQMTAEAGVSLKAWILIFLLVSLQMTTALRPILGTSNRFLPAPADKKFFVAHWMDCVDLEMKSNSTNSETGHPRD